MSIKKVKSELKKFDKEIIKIAQKAIFENEDIILELLKGQIENSQDSKGGTFDKYAESTESYWRHADPPLNRQQFELKTTNNNYSLVWSGRWIRSIYFIIKKDGFTFKAADPKDSIVEGYSKRGKIKKLNKKNMKNVNENIVIPFIEKEFYKRFGLFI